MKQSRYNYAIMKDSLIGISFGSELKFVCYQKCLCVVHVIIQHHGSVVTSTNLGPVFPCLFELCGNGVEMIQMTGDGPAAGRRQRRAGPG